MRSAMSGLALMSRRKSSRGICRTRPSSVTRAVRYGRCPVRRFNSPRKAPGAIAGDDGLAVEVQADDLGPSAQNDEEVVGHVARPVQDVAGADGAALRRTAASSESAAASRDGATVSPSSSVVDRSVTGSTRSA